MHRRWHLYRAAEPARGPGVAVLLVGVFAALVLVMRLLCEDAIRNVSFWPANAAIVVAILTLPRNLSVPAALACFGMNLALNRVIAYTPVENLLYSSLNVGVSYLTAFLARSLCGADIDLTRFRRLTMFAGIAFVSAGTEAIIGDIVHPGLPVNGSTINDWLQWTLCDGLGLLLATPAILLVVKSLGTRSSSDAGAVERWTLLVLTVVLTVVSFSYSRSPLFLLIYPSLVAMAFRAGAQWVLASVVLVSIIASSLTAHGYGPIVRLSPSGRFLRADMLQPYLVSLFLVAVPTNNALGEKARTAQRLRRMKATVEHAATHDALTSLVNRELFQRRLASCLQVGSACAVLFVDLDRFKQVNDTLGHQAGDELLRAFSGRLAAVARGAEALVARFGGDEFAVLVTGEPGLAQVKALCGAIADAAKAPFNLARRPAHVSASIGVALTGAGHAEASEVMRKADIALYAAKAAGRDCHRIFSEELDRICQDRAELETDLRAALDGTDELSLHYQLKVSRGGRIRGVEALVRWRHPCKGLILPGRFISVAEETGLIVALGGWVIREAIAFAERWPQLSVAVNVSPVQLRQPEFVVEVLDMLRVSPVKAGRLELEVTETVLLDEVSPTTASLLALRTSGLRIALDDFGTGYSSLHHLRRFAVDRVKIDQTFVAGMDQCAESAAIVHAIIQLGHAMKLQVTAEGVETEAQRDFLIAAGIDELQGYLFAQPVDEAALGAALLRASAGTDAPMTFAPDLEDRAAALPTLLARASEQPVAEPGSGRAASTSDRVAWSAFEATA